MISLPFPSTCLFLVLCLRVPWPGVGGQLELDHVSTLGLFGIKLLEAIEGCGLIFVELEIFVARFFVLLPGGVGVRIVLSFGGVRSVVIVLVLLGVRAVVSKLRLVFCDVGASCEASGLAFAVAFGVAPGPSTVASVTAVREGTAT